MKYERFVQMKCDHCGRVQQASTDSGIRSFEEHERECGVSVMVEEMTNAARKAINSVRKQEVGS